MDKTWYIDECNRQLSDIKFYERLDKDITANVQERVTIYVNGMHDDGFIDDKTREYLIQTDVKPGQFYILPKVHKPGNPGRPIVSSNSHPTERISHFVDYYLQPLVHKLPSFVKDTNDFLNKLLTISTLPANSLLVTLDVSSLYTNIPHNEGIYACDHFLTTASHKTIPTTKLCDLIRVPFITTFNPSLPHISNIIKRHFHLLLSSNRCKTVFQQLPVVAFRRSPNLRDLLVKAKLPSNLTNPHPQLPSGSFRCGKNCATCPYITDGLTTYTFLSTGETRHIQSNLTCDTQNLIYMIQCNRCNLQ